MSSTKKLPVTAVCGSLGSRKNTFQELDDPLVVPVRGRLVLSDRARRIKARFEEPSTTYSGVSKAAKNSTFDEPASGAAGK